MRKEPVTEELCQSRRETMHEEINGIKTAIYVGAAASTTIIVIAEFLLTHWHV